MKSTFKLLLLLMTLSFIACDKNEDVYKRQGNERTFEVLDTVFSEVARLFPSPYIHIGGDECYKGLEVYKRQRQSFRRRQIQEFRLYGFAVVFVFFCHS